MISLHFSYYSELFRKKKTRKHLVFVNTSLNKEKKIAYWLVLHTYMNIKE